MRNLTILLLLGGALLRAMPSAAQELDYWQLLAVDRATFRIDQLALMPVSPTGAQDMIIGDRYGYLRALRMSATGAREVWRSPALDGAVLEVLVEDLDGDGPVEVLGRTRGGRIYIYDELYKPLWENLREDYSEIQCMAIANMDSDVPYELVLLNDRGFIDYIDGDLYNREFRSTQTYRATQMLIGNVDTDPDLEIVLNTGQVIDAVIAEPQWSTEAFGERIELLDIDGDGIEEVLGYTTNQIMRIFDVDDQQEKPLR